ncbi:hypothetical protein JWV37_10325 [Sulfurospirillum sp. T05]|uniref:Type II/III secretion system secretin-like domain-containing protein n=1 Tax=Sulfurospirillum tamanense TaxID=2813362 RepID=A0ABS2WU52_9BACT|nr:hypothetical protein [Sulfurospirillum tamanensis]MBN2965177.1 hypothetical protein [Sulfurospirillum tamanensis]
MKKILNLLMFLLLSVSLFADNSLRRVSYLEFIEIVSFTTGKAVFISDELSDLKNINFFIPSDVNDAVFFPLLESSLKSQGLRLSHTAQYIQVIPIIEEKYYLHRFSHADPKDVNETLSVFDEISVQYAPSINAVSYRATNDQHKKIQTFLQSLDVPKAQRDVKITILTTDINELQNVGSKISGLTLNLDTYAGAVLNSHGSASTFTHSQYLQFKAELEFLKENGVTTIEQSPTLMLRDNVPSSLKYVDTIPYQVSTTSIQDGKATTQEETQYKDVGLHVNISPRIFTGYTFLKLSLIVEDITNLTERPTTRKIEYTQDFKLQNGEVLILTGITKTENKTTNTKVPFLGDIPLLGLAFSHAGTTQNQKVISIIIEDMGRADGAEGGTSERHLSAPLSIYQKTPSFKVGESKNE